MGTFFMRGFFPAEFAELFGFAANDEPRKVDALIFIQGDGLSRPETAVRLYKEGWARKIVVTGETRREVPPKESRTAPVVREMVRKGIPREKIIVESNSTNTREQAVEILNIAKKKKWKSVMLVVALYHQPRAYATFLRRMNEMGLKLLIVNHPVRGLPWCVPTSYGNHTRRELLKLELKKINAYAKKGHVAGLKEITAYQAWKENRKS